jgi:long-subunit acyl-CoA synthetase (AMP-forming)
MSRVVEAIRRHAEQAPHRVAIDDGWRRLTYAALLEGVEATARRLRKLVPEAQPIAMLADNGSDWILTDLAALLCGIAVVPIPLFFSPAQIEHTLASAGIRHLVTNHAVSVSRALNVVLHRAGALTAGLDVVRVPSGSDAGAKGRLQADIAKVTFTSGTTAEPKGACLTIEQIETTAESLRVATNARADDRHLCMLPLATLLENVGGVYTPLLAGASIIVPSLARIGLSGSSGLDVATLMKALDGWRPSSVILVPQMLEAILQAARAGLPLPKSLRYVAVGGAPISTRTLDLAERLQVPVYEGYGLSECASVVALNRPEARRPGSVGKPLPHVQVEIAADGEILVCGIDWPGYLGAPHRLTQPIATGDLGYVDADGYLYVTGRKKSVYITSFGRNVSPEWVERELVAQAPITQAALFGDARPFNTAIIVARPGASEQAIAAALEEVNRSLPDYARVRTWIRARTAFSVDNGMSTANGRLRREPIFAAYADQLASIYQH